MWCSRQPATGSLDPQPLYLIPSSSISLFHTSISSTHSLHTSSATPFLNHLLLPFPFIWHSSLQSFTLSPGYVSVKATIPTPFKNFCRHVFWFINSQSTYIQTHKPSIQFFVDGVSRGKPVNAVRTCCWHWSWTSCLTWSVLRGPGRTLHHTKGPSFDMCVSAWDECEMHLAVGPCSPGEFGCSSVHVDFLHSCTCCVSWFFFTGCVVLATVHDFFYKMLRDRDGWKPTRSYQQAAFGYLQWQAMGSYKFNQCGKFKLG